MDWTVISGVADTVAAFGVIGSLILVGFQVRQNSAGLCNAAAQSLMSTYQDLFSNIIDPAEFAEIFRQRFQAPVKLDDTSLVNLSPRGPLTQPRQEDSPNAGNDRR